MIVPPYFGSASVKFLDESFLTNEVRIEVTLKALPNDPFVMVAKRSELIRMDHNEIHQMVFAEALAYFTKIYTKPEPNIILGEN